MSYINREKLLRRCQKLATEYWKLKVTASAESIMNQFIDFVKEAPTADVVPVRHGKWCKKNYWSTGIGMGESYGYWYSCSECGEQVKGGYDRCGVNFCPSCGADMRSKK